MFYTVTPFIKNIPEGLDKKEFDHLDEAKIYAYDLIGGGFKFENNSFINIEDNDSKIQVNKHNWREFMRKMNVTVLASKRKAKIIDLVFNKGV